MLPRGNAAAGDVSHRGVARYLRDLLLAALDAAAGSNAAYADARIVETTTESIAVRGPVVESLDHSTSEGIGVRVLLDGAWGYAATRRLDETAATEVAARAVEVARAGAVLSPHVELVPEPVHVTAWTTPVQKDPFAVAVDDKVGLLSTAARALEAIAGVTIGRATMDLWRQRTIFGSTEGSLIEQDLIHSGAGIDAVAVDGGDVQTRSYPGSFRGHSGSGGYEIVEAMDLAEHAPETGEEAVALLTAAECPDCVTTLVLDGHQVMLQVHESVGHPTELDRVLGMEAAYAGTSFVAPSDVGSLRYGSDLVNITADATIPGGLGSFGFDDEGVAAQRVDLVKDGMLAGFQTSRETAAAVGQQRSNGTMRAEGWENVPLIRMTNINLLPGTGSLDDLLADVDDGIFMVTNKSWSIDDRRENFQFACEIAWEIKRGRLGRMLKNPRYTGMTQAFWSSCDAVAGSPEWRVWGTPNCGKGQPGQTMRVGHGTAPARFRSVTIGTGSST